MKKKSTVVVGLLAISLLLINVSAAFAADGKLNIISTTFPGFDFSRQITGDLAEVSMLLPPGAESHSYEPAPRDILKIQNADLFIYIGGEGDQWVDRILKSLGDKQPRTFKMMESAQLVPEETVEGMQADHDHEHEHDEHDEHGEEEHDHGAGVYDEHVWTSPLNAVKIVESLTKTISALDEKNAAAYAANLQTYTGQLTELDQQFSSLMETAKRHTIIVGDRFPFRYFADRYGLDYYAAFPGCSTEVEPSAQTVAFLINKTNEEKIPVVFYIEFSNHKIADAIAEATGAKTLLLHSAHNVSQQEIEAGATYVSLMTNNLAALQEAVN